MADINSTNSAVKGYRQWLESDGSKDPRSDIELTMELGDALRAKGNLSVEENDPEFRRQYLEAKQSTDRGMVGEVGAGIRRGARGLASTAVGATALGASMLGMDETAHSLVQKSKELEEGGEDNAPTVSSLGDVQDVGGAIRYAAGKVGEAAPSIGEAILTGLIGGGAGTLVEPGGGTVVGAAAGLIERQTIKNLIKKKIAGLAETATEAEVKAALKTGANTELRKAFTKEAGDIAKRVGSGVASGVNSYGLSAGEIYNDTEDTGLALGAGAVAAVPDTILPQMVMSRFFKGAVSKEMEKEAGTYFGRLLKDASKEVPIEAGTEAFQELVGIAAKKFKAGEPADLNDADYKRILEAAVGGAAGGGLAAPLSAAGGHSEATPLKAVTSQTREEKIAAARKNATQQQEEPAPAREKSKGEAMRDLGKMPDDQQDARITVLNKLEADKTISKAEAQELEVLRAFASQRPAPAAQTAQAAPKPAAAAPATTATPSLSRIEELEKQSAAYMDERGMDNSDNPGRVAQIDEKLKQINAELTSLRSGATPSAPVTPAAAPTTPLVAPVEPPKAGPAEVVPPTTSELRSRTVDAGRRLSRLMTQVPSLNVAEGRDALQAIIDSGTASDAGLTALETTLTNLEAKSVTEAARIAAERADAAGATAKTRAEAASLKIQRDAKRAADALQKQVEKLAKKIGPEPVETPKTDATEPDVSSMLFPTPADVDSMLFPTPVVTDPTLTNQVAEALKPTPPAAPAAPAAPVVSTVTTPFKFGKITLDSKMLEPGELPDLTGAQGPKGGSKLSRVAIAIQGPDNRVHLRGANYYDTKVGLKKVGAKDVGFSRGISLQNMGRLLGRYKDGKEILPGGNQQVLLSDLLPAGYKVLAQINFSGDVGVISEDFASPEDFQKTWDNSEAVPGNAAKKQAKEMAATAAIAAGDTTASGSAVDKLTARMAKLVSNREDVSLNEDSRRTIDSAIARLQKQIDAKVRDEQNTTADVSIDAAKVEANPTLDTEVDVTAPVEEETVGSSVAAENEVAHEDTPGGRIASFLSKSPAVMDEITQRMTNLNGDLSSTKAGLTRSYIAKTIALPANVTADEANVHLASAWKGAKVGSKTDRSLFNALIQQSNPLGGEELANVVSPLSPELLHARKNYTIPVSGKLGDLFATLPWSKTQLMLIERIGPYVDRVPFRLVEDRWEGVAAFNGSDGVILNKGKLAKTPNMAREAVMHEAVHAATMMALKISDQAGNRIKRINDIRARAAEAYRASGRKEESAGRQSQVTSALSSPHEFIAYAMTNVNFQKFLAGVTSDGPATREGSLLDRFWRVVADVLGISDSNLLAETMKAAEDVVATAGYKEPFDWHAQTFMEADSPLVYSSSAPASSFSKDAPAGWSAIESDLPPSDRPEQQKINNEINAQRAANRAIYAHNFTQLLERLRSQGHDITILQKELLKGTDYEDAGGWYQNGTQKIFVVMQDVTSGTVNGLAVLIHELAHKVMKNISPARSLAVLRAAQNTITSVRDTARIFAPANAMASAEEKIVSTLGMKLAEEGFGNESATLGQAIWRATKELYYTAANALLRSIGANPSDTFVLNWFENTLRREVGGDVDFRFLDLMSPFSEGRVDRQARFARVGGAPVPDFIDPATGKLTQTEVRPDTAEAAEWNLDNSKDFSLEKAKNSDGSDMDSTTAMAHITTGAWNEVIPILKELKEKLGKTFTDSQFWARFARGDLPSSIIDRMEQRAPGSSLTKITDAIMTEPMVQKSRYLAYTIASSLANRASRKSAELYEHANKAGETLVDEAKRLNRIEREHRDASAVNAHFNETLRDNIKEFAADLDRGMDTSFAAGKLMGAVREAERLTKDQAIPEEYQRVFKKILDSDGTTSLFDKLEAVSKLDLSLSTMSVSEIIDAIKESAPKYAPLKSLVDDRPLLVAVASLARQSVREMDLLQLRVMKNTTQYLAIKAQLDEIRTANDGQLDQMAKDIKTSSKNQGIADRLRSEFLKARREFRSTQRVILRAEENARINSEVADRMRAKATELGRDVGEFSAWTAHDGATYRVMRLNDDGTWSSTTRTLRMTGEDVGQQREQLRRDLSVNQMYLDEHKELDGSRFYNEVKRQTYELGVAGIGDREYRAAHRFLFDRMLQPLGQRFQATGTAAGRGVQQMLNRWQFITKTHADEVEARARKWDHSFQAASKAAGFKYGTEFMQQIYDPVIYAIESEPGRDEAGALRVAVAAAKRRIPEGYTVADDFAEKLGTLMRATKDMSEKLNAIAEQQGVYIADKRLKDPLTGKNTMLRHSIKYGWLTNTRKLRAEVIATLKHDMTGAGWSDEMFDSLPADELDDASFKDLLDTHFTSVVRRNFVEPFVNKPGKEVFFGADNDGEAAHVSQIMAQQVWMESGGDVGTFIDSLFRATNQSESDEGLSKYRVAMLQRFAGLYKMESRLAERVSVVKDQENPDGPKAHRIMDSRTNDLIPPEHFKYDVFDPASARIGLGEIAYHAAFGRDGAAFDQSVLDMKSDLQRDARKYDELTGPKKRKKEQAAERGIDFKKVERAKQELQTVDGLTAQLRAYFGGANAAGALGDSKTMLELLQLNTQLVLNQPKSGLWNVLSLADFPIAFRGINRSSLNAMRFASGSLAKNVFGSFLESVGVNVLHASEYAKEIGQHFEGRETERLPYGVFMSDIGKGGAFENSTVTPIIRKIQQGMRRGVKFGKGNDFAGNNAVWAPFNYINTQVASANATGTVQTFELLVKKAANFFQQNPAALNDPTYKLTAEDLGMVGKFGFFSDEGSFDFFRRATDEYRLGGLENVVRDAMKRMEKGERLLTKEQVLSLAVMANNELSLESSINSRPSAMFNNPVLRLGGLLMGWPLAKMNQVHQSLKTADGQLDFKSTLKGLGVLAAWSLPIGLAYSLLMDRYDDDVLNKKSNLRGIDPIAGVPLVGPLLALVGGKRGFKENALGMLERTAKAGNVWGMAGDFANSMANIVDPTSGQRAFDLNSRVLAFSQFANMRDTFVNLIHQRAATYSTVVRPLLISMGGNGVLQYQQILNNALGLDNAEAEVTNRTNVGNYLRAAGREAGIELRGGEGKSSPTTTSVWVREMQLAALANDRLGFLEAYRNAVDAADGDEQKIIDSWKERDPMKTTFRTAKLSDTDMAHLMEALGPDGRKVVNTAEDMFARYSSMIVPSPMAVKMRTQMKAEIRRAMPPDPMVLRRQMAAQMSGY